MAEGTGLEVIDDVSEGIPTVERKKKKKMRKCSDDFDEDFDRDDIDDGIDLESVPVNSSSSQISKAILSPEDIKKAKSGAILESSDDEMMLPIVLKDRTMKNMPPVTSIKRKDSGEN
jgi:hypothetical protein